MRKLNISQIALESEAYGNQHNTSGLPEHWQDNIATLVEQGPIEDTSVLDSQTMVALEQHGYATRVVSFGETNNGLYATLKGRDLYVQSVCGEYGKVSLEEAMIIREDTQRELHVSTEGFVDWIKDFFTHKLKERDINTTVNSVKRMSLVVQELNSQIKLDPETSSIPLELSYLVYAGYFTNDIISSIIEETDRYKDVFTAISNINDALSDAKSHDFSLIEKLVNVHWLGGLLTTKNKNKVNTKRSHTNYINEKETLEDYIFYAELADSKEDAINNIVGASSAIKENNKGFDDNLKSINQALNYNASEFKKVSIKLVDELNKGIEILKSFMKKSDENRKSNSSEDRELIRIGHNLSLFIVHQIHFTSSFFIQLNNLAEK